MLFMNLSCECLQLLLCGLQSLLLFLRFGQHFTYSWNSRAPCENENQVHHVNFLNYRKYISKILFQDTNMLLYIMLLYKNSCRKFNFVYICEFVISNLNYFITSLQAIYKLTLFLIVIRFKFFDSFVLL